jgi:hypothetical protein
MPVRQASSFFSKKVMDDDTLLAPDFDPNTLTIPQLKSALGKFGAPVPPRQERKATYVQLYRDHISTNPKLRRRVVPSAQGVTVVKASGSPDKKATKKIQEETRRTKADRSSFSNDNPFQKPVALSSDSEVDEEYEQLLMDEPPSPVPIRSRSKSAVRKPISPPRPMRFVAPEQLKVAGYMDPRELMSRARRRRAASASSLWAKILFGILLVSATCIGIYLQQYRSLPYCGSDIEPEAEDSLYFGVPVPLPSCRKCPPHATCHGNDIEKCTNGYLIRKPVFPLHSFCAADVAKYAYIDAMASELESLLSSHAGLVECGELVDHPYLSQERAKSQIRLGHLDLEDERFDSYWDLLMDDLQSGNSGSRSFEVKQRGESSVFLSHRPAYPLMCRIIKTFAELLEAYRWTLVGICVALVSLLFGYVKYNQSQRRKRRVLDLVDGVVEALIKQESLFRTGMDVRSAVSISQLRDFFLPNIRSMNDRRKLWDEVRKELLHNSSVRETVVLVEGEQHDAWQWIGSTILSPNSRKSFGSSVRHDTDLQSPEKPVNEPTTSSLYPSLL